MVFILKQRSIAPRMLCASQCPPDNVMHDISDYPMFYDPIYEPKIHDDLFESEERVCKWLLTGLKNHGSECIVCSPLPDHITSSEENVCCNSSLFQISFRGVSLQVPFCFVEHHSFSFCKLHRLLVMSFLTLQSTCSNVPHCVLHAGSVHSHMPIWLSMEEAHCSRSLAALPLSELRRVTRSFGAGHLRSKIDIIRAISVDFFHQRSHFWTIVSSSNKPWFASLSEHFRLRYGDCVSSTLRDVRDPQHFRDDAMVLDSLAVYDNVWLTRDYKDMSSTLSSVSKEDVLKSLHLIPSHLRPPFRSRSVRACRGSLLSHIRSRISYLGSLTSVHFSQVFFSIFPFHTQCHSSRTTLTELILNAEYGSFIICNLQTPLLSKSAKQSRRQQDQRDIARLDASHRIQDICSAWPQKVSDDVVFQCLENYRLQTIWVPPVICCVCGLERNQVEDIVVSKSETSSIDFSILHVRDPFITDVSCFQYDLDIINNAVLDNAGFKSSNTDSVTMQICNECLSALRQKRLPRLSLANHLYRGVLPEEFRDLTWVEEMVCAKYRNTAHVTRIYGSCDPSQPKVFHGNTCAHEMNVLSTASVLPRTIADINDMLTVVFLGPEKFDPKSLGHMFRIRKKKVWSFLLWLTTYNRLYVNIPLDSSIMDAYPDDDILPGIEHRIFEDHNTDVAKIFTEETAGFAEHPAQLMNNISDSKTSSLLIENMGVSDPDGFKINGRSSTASALKKLFSNHTPDLILHQSSNAIVEYDNPDLMPGMFPTLFPLGIGGFENPARTHKVSFQSHANSLLDVPDRSFRHHQTFIFVALNIMQRRLCHLHTHFTVRKSNFDSIATKLTALSPDILTRLADHLQQEHSATVLTNSDRDAFTLLNYVNTISARIPGSQAAKIFTRNEIRSYFGEFGLPHLYFTFNPSVTHSPIFQLMVGDRSVDLSTQFPFVVPNKDRALRLVKDPIAAADFFEFCVSSVFQHLFGWDYDRRKSSEKGGILGHLCAFYGTCEFTERGSLHGHFLIWLLGGLNPNDIHQRLKEDAAFKTRFFAFFEDIIQHDLPDVDVIMDPTYEPRVERPPFPPKPSITHPECTQALHEWQMFMDSEVKKLGEVLQHHKCKPVCHKYGNTNNCRFLFPHDIELQSYFEEETNPIIFKCLDSMVNYFNRYILVYCRHNHDIKCILSGKAAKAVMCYITDYITKMDMKTYQILSLLSRAVASVPQESEIPVRQRGRTLLHKCLTQFTRQQQIHAQQAARYLRGNDDTITSHETTPMMSALLLDFVQTEYHLTLVENVENDEDKDETEHAFLNIQTDHNGKLVKHNQLTDYWYRDRSLSQMNFYDFARCMKLQIKPKPKSRVINNDSDRQGVQKKFPLLNDHPLAETHHLIQRMNDNCPENGKQYVPRIIGAHIPREANNIQWKIFTLAHFKPFDAEHPLLKHGDSIEDTFHSFPFSTRSRMTMKNWEDVHECEDKRDEDRLRKRMALTAESLAMTKTVNETSMKLDLDDTDIILPFTQTARKDFVVLQAIHVLEQSHWLTSPFHHTSTSNSLPSHHASFPIPSASQLKAWMKSLKQQEKIIAHSRQNGNSSCDSSALKTETIKDAINDFNAFPSFPIPFSSYTQSKEDLHKPLSADDIITKIGKEYNLQSQQWIAFRIITQSFFQKYVLKQQPSDHKVLRMFLTGPGGTGKTHVVKAVQKVMEYYGAGHTIRFLAPTGSAASLIDGMTIHKGLGIKIQSHNKGKSNRNLGENREDYNVIITVQNKTKLRNEWRLVEIVMIDECSLLSAELLSQIDAALRFAKEKPDEWFGGIIVIFAGDFYQYPPVCATPLYNSIPSYSKTSDSQLARRLGRLAWKSVNAVVTFTDQKRMKDDVEYATAVTHLRTRECTMNDVDLFNTRLIKSASHENGIDMSIDENFNATAIVPTNLLRQTMNIRKAETNCFKYNLRLTNCAAIDTCSSSNLSQKEHEDLLHLDMSSSKLSDALPGFLPLFVGMPIVLKSKNISTDLGITNGCQGYIREFYTKITSMNLTYCTCAIVEFPDSRVNLSDLPLHHFPITPVSTSFITELSQSTSQLKRKIKITRTQLPIQPAFAVTGHSAEGKTLPTVLTNLHEGGFSAYVAASRARSRKGLFITEPVSLQDLNKPIPYSLLQESKRLHAIEHNTSIQFGFKQSEYESIPDPESEQNLLPTTFTPTFHTPSNNPPTSIIKSGKRKLKDIQILTDTDNSTFNQSKRRRITKNTIEISAGCTWSSSNWSCAYDCIVMSLFYSYLSFNNTCKENWSQQTALTNILTVSFENLISTPPKMMSSMAFNVIRDRLRDFLSQSDPNLFPRFGAVGAPANEICHYLSNAECSRICLCHTCSSTPPCTPSISTSINEHFPSIFLTSLWTTWSEQIGHHNHPHTANTQDWIDLYFETQNNIINQTVPHNSSCPTSSTNSYAYVNNPSPLLTFEIAPAIVPLHVPKIKIKIRKRDTFVEYYLRAIIYLGNFHFTARLIDACQRVWIYDSQKNDGNPSPDKSMFNNLDLQDVTTLDDRCAHLYVYAQ